MAYLCDNHPDTAGVLLITNLETGDTIVLCGADVHDWAQGIADATRPEDLPHGPVAAVDERTGDESDEPGDEAGTPAVVPAPEPPPGPGTADLPGTEEDETEPGFSESTLARALADPTGPEAVSILAGSQATPPT